MLPKEGQLLRIFIGESDQHENKPLYEWILHKAHSDKMAGVTILRGIEGYGASTRIHTAKVLRLSQDLPIVIELIDTKEKIQQFIASIDEIIKGGIATIEDMHIRFYRSEKKTP